MSSVSPTIFANLSSDENADLHELLKSKPTFMPHELAVRLGITREEAINIMYALWIFEFVDLKKLVYHNCDLETPFETIPYGENIVDGLPDLPLHCEECDRIVEDPDELEYDLVAKVKYL